MENNTVFKTLSAVDLTGLTETRESWDGKTLTYLSWAKAWQKVMEIYPNATYEIETFGDRHLPYIYDPLTGYMVFVSITIEGVVRKMHMAVTDCHGRAMKAKPYEVKFASGQSFWVVSATMNDINSAIMRCLTKCLAMHGLGLYIYAGEDVPFGAGEMKENEETIKTEESVTAEMAAADENATEADDDSDDSAEAFKTLPTDKVGQAHIEELKKEARQAGIDTKRLCERYHKESLAEFTIEDYEKAMRDLAKTIAHIKKKQNTN